MPSSKDVVAEAVAEANAEIERLKAEAEEVERLSKPTNVIQALARIMEEMPGVAKDQKSEQGYKYRGIEQITARLQTLMGKYGVVFVPEVRERVIKDLTINNKPWTQDELVITYTVYGPGGVDDKIVVGPLYGLGRDNSDKGVNKAMTQAFKYALLQVFSIGDSNDDADKDVAHEADARQQKPPLDPEARLVADEWPDDDAFDGAHASYREAFRKLTSAQKQQLKEFKATNKFGLWMTPDEFDATMKAIEEIKEAKDPQPSEEKPAESPETPEAAPEAQPEPEKEERPPAPVEQAIPGAVAVPLVVEYNGISVDNMSGRVAMEALQELGLPVSGKVTELRDRLREHLTAQSEVTETQQEISGEQPGDNCQFCGENPCVCNDLVSESNQEEAVKTDETAVENYAPDDPARPF